MVLIDARFNLPPEQPGPAQQFEPDASPASFLYEAVEPPAAPVPGISGERRRPRNADGAALDGLRRILTMTYGLDKELTQQRFCMEALAAAGWDQHQVIRDWIAECDPDGQLLGLRKKP